MPNYASSTTLRSAARSWAVDRSLPLVCLASALLIGVSLPALAQSETGGGSQASAIGLETVVVTAERRSEKLQDTPAAVTAMSSENLEARGVTNLGQLSEFVPSLELHSTNRPGGGGSALAAYIRGVGTGDYNFPTDPAIGVYIDGVYMARSLGGLLSLSDISQIQVLRGPQGTLYGRNTLGGAILITTQEPEVSGQAQLLAEVHAGSDGRADFIGSVNTPLEDGKVGMKLSVATFNSSGFGRQITTGLDLSDEHRILVRGGLRFDLGNSLTLDIDADYTYQNNHPPVVANTRYFAASPLVAPYNAAVVPTLNTQLGLPAGSLVDGRWTSPSIYSTYSTAPVKDNYNMGGLSARLVYAPSEALEIKSITAFRALEAHIDVEADGTPYQLFTDWTADRDNQVSEEVTAGGKVAGGRLNYLVGVYLFRELGHSRDYTRIFHGLYEATGNSHLALDSITFQRMESLSYSAFTQETYALFPHFHLTTGARLTYDQKNYDAFVTAPQRATVAVPDQKGTPDWKSFTPKFGADWKPSDNVMLYVSYAEGFKSGGLTQPSAALPVQGYDPETLDTYEAGLKTSWFDNRLTANFDGYYSTYKGVQLTSIINLPSGSIVKETQNAGNARIYGFEAEIDATPTPGLLLNLSADYTHDRFTELSPGAISALHAHVGERLPQIPDYDIHAGAQYAFAIPSGTLTLRGDASVTGKAQMSIGDPTSYQDSYILVNASVTYDPDWGPNWEFAFHGANITDQRYFVYDQSQASLNQQLVIPGAPLEWYFSARYKL